MPSNVWETKIYRLRRPEPGLGRSLLWGIATRVPVVVAISVVFALVVDWLRKMPGWSPF